MGSKLRLLLELGKPRVLLLMGLVTCAGAALSPHFLSPAFPVTRLGRTALFEALGAAFPRAFSPPLWSLAHALGAALVVALLWLGTALVNDCTDRKTDAVSSPGRPLPSGRIRAAEVVRWAVGCQVAALCLIALEGTFAAFVTALLGIALGNAYSLPPLRLRRSGMAANLIIGAGVAMAMVGGMTAQGPVPEVGVLAATLLGLLAAAASMVKDFKDVAGDRVAGLRTLPVLVGTRRAALLNLAAVAPAYLLLLGALAMRVGPGSPAVGLLSGLGIVNLALLAGFLRRTDAAYARLVYGVAIFIFMGVTAVYAGAHAVD